MGRGRGLLLRVLREVCEMARESRVHTSGVARATLAQETRERRYERRFDGGVSKGDGLL
jgi:hypothetical protein